MGKVVTGKGMDDFVQKGTVETIKNDPKPKRGQAAASLEVVPPAPVVDTSTPETPSAPPPEDIYAGEDDETKAEVLKAKKFDALMHKKHRELKAAEALAKRLQGELEDNESFSKSQFDRARMAEEKLTQLERELGDLKAKAPKAEVVGQVKPDPKDFYDAQGQFKAFEYAEKLAEYSATKAVEDDRKRQNEERTRAQQAEMARAFEARLEKAREKYSDWKEIVGASDMIVPPYVQQFMVRSPFGGDLGYWFARNPDEAKRIFALDPIDAIAELGEITVQWKKPAGEAPKPNNVVPIIPKPGAPAPITPLPSQASAQTNTDPAKMNFQQLRAYEREKAQSKRR